MVSSADRKLFDRLLDRAVAELPPQLHELLEEVPLVVEDEPSAALLEELGFGPDEDLCGLHQGIAITERSVEHSGTLPDHMMLFRGPILRLADDNAYESGGEFEPELDRQIRITLLHEIGHHFGLDEDDLDALGYG